MTMTIIDYINKDIQNLPFQGLKSKTFILFYLFCLSSNISSPTQELKEKKHVLMLNDFDPIFKPKRRRSNEDGGLMVVSWWHPPSHVLILMSLILIILILIIVATYTMYKLPERLEHCGLCNLGQGNDLSAKWLPRNTWREMAGSFLVALGESWEEYGAARRRNRISMLGRRN